MPPLRQGLSIEKILLIEIDLREMFFSDLYFNSARGARSIPTTVVIERKPQGL
jgi:hypothetical protein